LLFAALREPPEPGSLRESVMMLYVLKKEQVEHARLRALAQAVINRDKGKEVFEEYMAVAFPWLETQKKRATADHVRILMDEVKKGGLGIKPLWQQQMKSRMKVNTVERQQQPARGKTRAELNDLYEKLGKVKPG
jgi:hypothetical protein